MFTNILSVSGLDNFGARYFTSNLGRFMTPDWAARPTAVPYAVFGDPQSLNLYTYVENEPLNRIDADGHCGNDSGFMGSGASYACVTEAKQSQDNAGQKTAESAQNHGSEPQPKLSATSGRIVDDFSGGISGHWPASVSYDKNIPPMTDETKQYIEKTATNAGLDSVNITATTNGEHAPNSNHYNGTAVDINMVNGGRVRTSGSDPEVARHVGWLQQTANDRGNGVAHENYGPAGLYKDGRAINNPTLQAQHENHIHITIPRDDQ
jgi:RHS repeat-associated protein